MAWIEDTAKRKQKEKHYRDDVTGQWRVEITIHDQHYKDSGDAWQEVDESLANDGQGGFDKKNDKTRHIFRIAGGGARRWYPRRNVATEYVDITNIQYWRTTGGGSWRNLNLPAAVWKQQGAEWDLPNLYASITNTWKRIKTEFILKDNTAPARLRFAVSFVGLTYNDTIGELTSTTDGLVWGYINKPIAQDANEAVVPVSASYDGTYIEWSADVTGATYPIYVDPTFTDGYGGDVQTYIDTFVNESSAGSNYATYDTIFTRGGGSSDKTPLLKFNLSSIPGGATISSATLSLWNLSSDASNRSLTASSILSANSAWTELGATWDYAVASTTRWAGDTGNDGGSDAGCSVSGTDYNSTPMGTFSYVANTAADTEHQCSLNTSQVTSWYSGSNYGLVIHQTQDVANFQWYSSDHATTGYRPKLVVEYTEAAAGNPWYAYAQQ